MKKVEIFYFADCPGHRPTVEKARAIIDEFQISARIEEREVEPSDNLEELKFLGSPTVLVDGIDIDPSARGRTDYGFSCRTYNGQVSPPREMLAKALQGDLQG